MSSIAISSIVLAIVFGGALLGLALRNALPGEHVSEKSQNAVTLGMGLVGTMAALILGLLVTSAKSSFDAQNAELTQVASGIVVLDRLLAHYGPETKDARETLRNVVASALDRMWSKGRGGSSSVDSTTNELLYDKIQALSPRNDAQHSLQSQALNMAISVGQTRWLMTEQEASSASNPFVIAMIFWLFIIFLSWGLYAPPNATVITAFFVAALSVSGAMFLIMEMYTPYGGLIQISSAPLKIALAHLGK